MERVHKVIAASGLASRRKAEQFIKDGLVAVNGTVITEPCLVDPEQDTIMVSGKPLPTTSTATYLFFKPRGVITSRSRQGKHQKIISDFFTNTTVYPVGRLDKDSEGLIVVTNDGSLTHKLTHPSFHLTKEYIVTARFEKNTRVFTKDEIEKRLLSGVKLGDGLAKADKVHITQTEPLISMRIQVHEGRHHLIRRMCATLGLDVVRLIRIKIGPLHDASLIPGTYRPLTNQEIKQLTTS